MGTSIARSKFKHTTSQMQFVYCKLY